MERNAVISPCGRYRYLLRRIWDERLPRAFLGMLNPSTADVKTDDATIRSVGRLLSALGYGSYEVGNAYAWRETDPQKLKTVADPVGPYNDHFITGAIQRCDVSICAWGANVMAVERERYMLDLMLAQRSPVYCFGTTKAGHPRHPLYIKTGTALQIYRRRQPTLAGSRGTRDGDAAPVRPASAAPSARGSAH